MTRLSYRRPGHRESGFTLVELLVVIIILGILSSVVVFSVRGTGDKGKASAVAIDKRTLVTAQQAYCAKTGTYGTEAQLTGAAPVTGSNPPLTVKFLSEQSVTHDVTFIGGGQCGTDPLTSGFLVTGDPAAMSPNKPVTATSGLGGGPLVVAVTGDPTGITALGLNPAVDTQGGMQNQSALLFNGLLATSASGTPAPELATEVPSVANGGITNNGKDFTFKLRTLDDLATPFDERVRWSDSGVTAQSNPTGMAQYLTAEDVKFSFEAALLIHHARTSASMRDALATPCTDPGSGTMARRLLCSSIVAVEANPTATPPTPATVTFKFADVFAPIFQQMAMTDGAIIAKHVWPTCAAGALGTCPAQSNRTNSTDPVGTGPFRFVSTSTTELKLQRNPNFWRPNVPYFNEVIYKQVGTAVGAGFTALKAGTVDYTNLSSKTDLVAAKANSAFTVDSGVSAPGGSTNCTLKVIFNLWAQGSSIASITSTPPTATNHPKLGDVNVRRAIAKALQRKPNVSGTNAGYVSIVNENDGSKLAESPVNSGITFASTPAPLPEFEPTGQTGSGTLLDTAGFPNTVVDATMPGGLKRFDLGISGFSGSQTKLMNTMRDDLALVGIKLVPNPAYGSFTVVPGDMTTLYRDRNFDSLLFSNCQLTDPEMGVRRVYHKSAITGVSFTNGAGYRNAKVDSWFNQARASLDLSVRRSFYKQISEQITADLPTLPLLENVSNRAYLSTCSGLRPYTGHFAEYGSCLR